MHFIFIQGQLSGRADRAIVRGPNLQRAKFKIDFYLYILFFIIYLEPFYCILRFIYIYICILFKNIFFRDRFSLLVRSSKIF
ncbi:hypothetical protein HanIR_Chr14g0726781 [Helianthus annuus]|nr:hypothetical protein HanIR_Chr14g0726781 [Helianthus annuus]